MPATDFTVSFRRSSKTTSFKYSESESLYYLDQQGGNYVDGNDSTQVSVTNVLILRTDISNIRGDNAGRLDTRTTGSGSGYYVNGGKYIEITWSRAGEPDQFRYTLTDGTELILGQGKSYICLISENAEIDFE